MPLSRQPAYAVLAEVSLGYPPQQGRFPRATHPCATHWPGRTQEAFDLHVLSMPPAFVLSQDQTLMFNPSKPAIPADRQIHRHRPGPRTEDRTQQGPPNAQRKIPPRPAPSRRQTRPYLARATGSPSRRPRIPSSPTMSINNPTASPPQAHTPETRRRGSTLIWPLPPHRQYPSAVPQNITPECPNTTARQGQSRQGIHPSPAAPRHREGNAPVTSADLRLDSAFATASLCRPRHSVGGTDTGVGRMGRRHRRTRVAGLAVAAALLGGVLLPTGFFFRISGSRGTRRAAVRLPGPMSSNTMLKHHRSAPVPPPTRRKLRSRSRLPPRR